MKRRIIVIAGLMVAMGCILFVSGCKKGEEEVKKGIPEDLKNLGIEFKSEKGNDRKELGSKIQLLMPTCVRKDASGKELAAMDYSNPSYVMTREQAIEILGEPDETDDMFLVYVLGTDKKRMIRQLLLELDSGRVVNARFDAAKPK